TCALPISGTSSVRATFPLMRCRRQVLMTTRRSSCTAAEHFASWRMIRCGCLLIREFTHVDWRTACSSGVWRDYRWGPATREMAATRSWRVPDDERVEDAPGGGCGRHRRGGYRRGGDPHPYARYPPVPPGDPGYLVGVAVTHNYVGSGWFTVGDVCAPRPAAR